MFRNSSRRATLTADVLLALLTCMLGDQSPSESSHVTAIAKIQSLYQSATLDVLNHVFPGPKMTQAQADTEFLAKYAKLSFLGATRTNTEGAAAAAAVPDGV